MSGKNILVINFKTYREATGNNAEHLARAIEHAVNGTKGRIVLAPQVTDLHQISHTVSLDVFSQHVDPITPGSHTGWILPESVKANGAIGSIINHSEHRMELDKIESTVKRCKELGLETIVCVETLEEGLKIAKLKPDYLAYEDPELIGSGRPISKEKPDSVREFAETIKKDFPEVTIICGAGISSGEDVKKSIELGCNGVLVASAIVKSHNPEAIVREMARYL